MVAQPDDGTKSQCLSDYAVFARIPTIEHNPTKHQVRLTMRAMDLLLNFSSLGAQFLLSFDSVPAQFLLRSCAVSAPFLLRSCSVSAQFLLRSCAVF